MVATALFFCKQAWTSTEVKAFLQPFGIDFKIRIGFQNIVAIVDTDPTPPIEAAPKPVLVLHLNLDTGDAAGTAYELSPNGPLIHLTQDLLESEINDIQWDIAYAALPKNEKTVEELYEALKNSCSAMGLDAVMVLPPFSDQAMASSMPDAAKRFLLDILVCRASLGHVQAALSGTSDEPVRRYTSLWQATMVTRSIIEKMMLLCAFIDPSLNFNAVDSSKKIRSVFLNQSKLSTWTPTTLLAKFLDHAEYLDTNFRNPETHKTGRLWSLICSNHYGTLINEVLSHYNDTVKVLAVLCESITETFPGNQPHQEQIP